MRSIGNREAAIVEYGIALELAPSNDAVLTKRGVAAYELGNFPAAVEDFSAAIELNPSNPENYLYRSRSYWKQRAYWSAIRDSGQYTRLTNPMWAAVLVRVTFAYLLVVLITVIWRIYQWRNRASPEGMRNKEKER
jgi:tetratricopeptide (TPR) repeat protein